MRVWCSCCDDLVLDNDQLDRVHTKHTVKHL
jgi:hypothetical protein